MSRKVQRSLVHQTNTFLDSRKPVNPKGASQHVDPTLKTFRVDSESRSRNFAGFLGPLVVWKPKGDVSATLVSLRKGCGQQMSTCKPGHDSLLGPKETGGPKKLRILRTDCASLPFPGSWTRISLLEGSWRIDGTTLSHMSKDRHVGFPSNREAKAQSPCLTLAGTVR